VTADATACIPRGERRQWVRIARIVALAVIIAVGVSNLRWAIVDWHMKDAGAYWEAALRLRHGQELFPAVTNIEASEVYRYSPWFAWLWVPLTYLPKTVAYIGWAALLIACSFVAVLPMARGRAWIGVAFFLPMRIGISATGNVQALLVAILVHSVNRRSGPLAIALAASLKLVPILLLVTYIGRRQWFRAGLCVVLTVVLCTPFLLYNLTNYVTDAGGAPLLWQWPVVYVLAVGLALALAIRLARGRYGWLWSATALTLALPRFFVYDITYLMVGIPAAHQQPNGSRIESSAHNTG
jgi:hypothetical protein